MTAFETRILFYYAYKKKNGIREIKKCTKNNPWK